VQILNESRAGLAISQPIKHNKTNFSEGGGLWLQTGNRIGIVGRGNL